MRRCPRAPETTPRSPSRVVSAKTWWPAAIREQARKPNRTRFPLQVAEARTQSTVTEFPSKLLEAHGGPQEVSVRQLQYPPCRICQSNLPREGPAQVTETEGGHTVSSFFLDRLRAERTRKHKSVRHQEILPEKRGKPGPSHTQSSAQKTPAHRIPLRPPAR